MMRRGGGGMSETTLALDTISAAATAIASSVEMNRLPQASSVQKRRWVSCLNLNWCLGSYKNNKRTGHAVLFPESSAAGIPTVERPSQPSSIFVVPPSSPASFLPSELHSSNQSPTGQLSLASAASASASANTCSPDGPYSIFAIGPYAHETQLVSPPVFSTFTTEPSTAPYTPPPESVHLTRPSSPDVPFAQLLEPTPQNGEACRRYNNFSKYEFQSYQLQPGSPVSHLISGTSSPFPDRNFANGLAPT